jgi:DNA-binding XRE family transcriptional regulator
MPETASSVKIANLMLVSLTSPPNQPYDLMTSTMAKVFMIDRDQFYFQLGMKLRSKREKAGLTQADLAGAIGISRTSLTNMECGKQRLLVDQLAIICRELEIDPSELIPLDQPAQKLKRAELADIPVVANFLQTVTGGSAR